MLLRELREQVIEAGLEANRRGIVHGTAGNFSIRDHESGLIAISPTGMPYGAMTAAIIAVITLVHGALVYIPTFLWSIGVIPSVDPQVYRMLWWALGHSSQQINVAAMVAIWYMLAALTVGGVVLNEKVSRTAFVLYILYALYLRFSGSEWPWQRKPAEAPDESWRPEEAPARQLLSEADALAARGLFSEAAHLLLFRSIEDIDQRRPELVRPALTSRDIAALPAIPDRPRGAFARIAAMVERSLFARRPLGADDWHDCRAAYEDFAFAEGWRG